MRALKAGVACGLVGGALDALAASAVYPAMYGMSVASVWQGVASGVMGPAAFDGGIGCALIGLALHFSIAIVAGLVLAAAMANIAMLRRYWVVTGTGFGVAVYFFMQKIVLPLSQVGRSSPDATAIAVGLAIHILIFGMPMAFVAARLLKKEA